MAQKVIRIGTRDSELALWQAHTVEKKLNDFGVFVSVDVCSNDCIFIHIKKNCNMHNLYKRRRKLFGF